MIAGTAHFAAHVIPQMKRTTIAKEFEAKQANATGAVLDRTLGAEAPLAATLGGVGGATTTDWQGSGISSEQFASKDEVGELRQAVAMKVSSTQATYLVCSKNHALHTLFLCMFKSSHCPASLKIWELLP